VPGKVPSVRAAGCDRTITTTVPSREDAAAPLSTLRRREALFLAAALASTPAAAAIAHPPAAIAAGASAATATAATAATAAAVDGRGACPAAAAGVRFDLASAILAAAYEGFDGALASGAAGAPPVAAAAATRESLRDRLAVLRKREYRYYLFEGPTREGERARPGYVAPPPPGRYVAEVEPLLRALEAGAGAAARAAAGSATAAAAGTEAVVVPPPIFDFAIWSLFKAIAAELPPSQSVGGARSEHNAACGRALARAVAADELAALRRQRAVAAASSSSSSPTVPVAPFAAVAAALETALARLAEGGYCCGFQVTWGEQPGAWPSDWLASEPQIVGDAEAEAARTLSVGKPLPLQIRVARPADVGASVALRNEEWGFCPRLVPGVFAAMLEAAGYSALVSATQGVDLAAPLVDKADVFYSQDTPMKAPSSVRDRLLLAFGDPLVAVVVSFTPETEVIDWAVVVPG